MQGNRKIAVAGATGSVGRNLVDVLDAAAHDVVAISRSSGVDLVTGDGLEAALTGVECVIDVTTGPSADEETATKFFTAASRNLHRLGERAGVRRIVVLSVIGCDRFAAGYNAAKLAHERAMLAGRLPVRILRAGHLHEFVAQIVDWGRQGDVSYVPEMRTQLVAARTVAETLAELATAPDAKPQATIPEIAGPREEGLVDAARQLAARRGDPRRIEPFSDPDDPDREIYESGGLLPGAHARLAGPTFAEWLYPA